MSDLQMLQRRRAGRGQVRCGTPQGRGDRAANSTSVTPGSRRTTAGESRPTTTRPSGLSREALTRFYEIVSESPLVEAYIDYRASRELY